MVPLGGGGLTSTIRQQNTWVNGTSGQIKAIRPPLTSSGRKSSCICVHPLPPPYLDPRRADLWGPGLDFNNHTANTMGTTQMKLYPCPALLAPLVWTRWSRGTDVPPSCPARVTQTDSRSPAGRRNWPSPRPAGLPALLL